MTAAPRQRMMQCPGKAAALGILLLFLALAAQSARAVAVLSAAEFLEALADPSVSTITVVKPFSMPHTGVKPVVVTRQLLITSPHRAMIDWCDKQCRLGNMSRTPFIVLGKGALLTVNRLFFKNLVPHTKDALQYPRLDFAHSPVPWIVSEDGGQAVYNLVVMHWTPPMFWVFQEPGTYWHEAKVASEIKSVGEPKPLQLHRPELYAVKGFSTDAGTATITDCYMPLDVASCLTDQPFDTTLIYCPYTFKDSLKNPWVDKVVVFHDVGLDRLVNTFRNPAVVNRTVVYTSCPNTRHVMHLDNISSSVVVTAGGSLTMQGLAFQGSKSQNMTDFPSNIPLLLSTFKPIESGTVTLRDCTVRVTHMDKLVMALSKLPSGSSTAVEVPDLQPFYASGSAPKPGAESFVIRLWQLQRQRWLLARTGATTIMDKMGSTSTATWQFFNVTVEAHEEQDCFGAAVTQGSAVRGRYSTVDTGQELLDQLANTSARYIHVTGNLNVPPNLGTKRITVSRIVEIRSCSTGAPYVLDWAGNRGAVVVTGNAIWQGNMVMTGFGWSEDTLRGKGGQQVVGAVQPSGTGISEYENVVLLADMPDSAFQQDNGKASVSNLLGVADLDAMPLNMTLMPGKLVMRGFYSNRSSVSSGAEGLESFQDVALCWTPVQGSSGSSSSQLSQGALAAAIVVPVLAVALCAAFAIFRRARKAGGGPSSGKGASSKGSLLPRFLGGVGVVPGDKPPAANGDGASPKGSATAAKPNSPQHGIRSSSGKMLVLDGSSSTIGSDRSSSDMEGPVVTEAQPSSEAQLPSFVASSGGSKSRTQSGFSDHIAEACKLLVSNKGVGRDDQLFLESVLGEGSYGKVFKATWRGTVVAVKVMVLPPYMSGKEKREKMAVMETAISSSLSHPNVVQTYTYAVEPVRSNSSVRDTADGNGPAADARRDSSSTSWMMQGPASSAAAGAGAACRDVGTVSWEVRLIQEYCDLGSLRSALKQNMFRSASGSVQLLPLVETALDVARAMSHLHKHNILHSDLKARNVLLRSDAHDSRGFTAKVADFGLSLTIDPNSTHISNAFQGTLPYMAPETMMHGHISRASDSFAFGILLYELWTGDNAYKGVPRALLGHNIVKQGLRPVFPPDTPFEWQFLACRCWESDPTIRPTFDQILEELKRIKARWAQLARSSSEGSAAAATPRSSSSIGSDSVQDHQQGHRPGALQQQAWQQQVGQLPSIQDTSDQLSSSDHPQQQPQQQQWQGIAPAAGPLSPAAHPAGPMEHLAGAAASGQQQQQAAVDGCPPVVCLEGSSRDVMLFLSDSDTTRGSSIRPA